MAFQSVPNTVEAVVRLQINGKVITMTFYGLFTGGYALADVQNLASQMDAWVDTELLPYVSTSATYLGVNCRGLEFENDVEAFNDTNAGAGGSANAPMPNNVCFCVKRESAFTGRSARGRVYVPINVAQIDSVDENRISASFATNITGVLNDVSTYMNTAGATEVIVSRYTGGAKRATGVTFAVVAYDPVGDVVDTQKRRLPKS